MHPHVERTLHREGAFPCIVKEVYRSHQINSRKDEPPLFQIQPVNTDRAAMFISLQLNGAAPQLKGLQRLCTLGSAEDSVKDDFGDEKKRQQRQHRGQNYNPPNPQRTTQAKYGANGKKWKREPRTIEDEIEGRECKTQHPGTGVDDNNECGDNQELPN